MARDTQERVPRLGKRATAWIGALGREIDDRLAAERRRATLEQAWAESHGFPVPDRQRMVVTRLELIEELDRVGEHAAALALTRRADVEPGPALARKLREATVRISTEKGYRTSIDAGDRAMVRGDYARAINEYRKAQRIKDTEQARARLTEAEAIQAEAAAADALAAGELHRVVVELMRAVDIRPTPELRVRLEDAKKRVHWSDERPRRQPRVFPSSLRPLDKAGE